MSRDRFPPMSRALPVVLVLATLVIFGCGGDDASAGTCTPMLVQPCPCRDGTQGSQKCLATGAGYEPCVCGLAGGSGAIWTAGQGVAGAGVSGSGALDGGSSNVIMLPDGAVSAADGGTVPDEPGEVVVEPNDEAASLWDDAQLRTFEITMAASDLNAMHMNPSAEQYYPATFKLDSETVASVGIRAKGSAGAFLTCTAPCTKPSMKVSFDWQLPDQRFHGLKKLNFHAMNDDDSLMRDRLGYALFREMGVVAPRATHARLLVNGELSGLYALVEEIDGRFTDAHFTAAGDGNLYKEIWPKWSDTAAYQASLRTNRDDPMVSFDRVIRFAQSVDAAADDAAVLALSDQWMSADYLMSYIAVDRTILNDDGIFHWYCNPPPGIFVGNNPGSCTNHNYFWYEEDRSDRLWLVQWDVTLAFKGETSTTRIVDQWNDTAAACSIKSNGSFFLPTQTAPACDKLTHAWATRTDAYKAAVKRFLEGPFSDANVSAKLSAWQAQIMPVVTEAASAGQQPSAASFAQNLTSLKTAIASLRSAAQTRAQ